MVNDSLKLEFLHFPSIAIFVDYNIHVRCLCLLDSTPDSPQVSGSSLIGAETLDIISSLQQLLSDSLSESLLYRLRNLK